MLKSSQRKPNSACSFSASWRCLESTRLSWPKVIENVLTFSITVWFGSASIHNKNMLEGIVKTASKITGSKLPSMDSIYTTRTLRKATTIISGSTHPARKPPLWTSFRLGSGSNPSKLELHALVSLYKSDQQQLHAVVTVYIKAINNNYTL